MEKQRRFSLVLLISMLLGNAAGAQSTERQLNIRTALDPSTVLSLLGSKDPREQAWGAWAAGERRIYEAVPLLQQMVEAQASAETWSRPVDRSPSTIGDRWRPPGAPRGGPNTK